MVKIRLKRLGYKKNPTYRIVVINDLQKEKVSLFANQATTTLKQKK